MNVEIRPEVTFGNEARVGRNPGLPGNFSKGFQIPLLPGSDGNVHDYRSLSIVHFLPSKDFTCPDVVLEGIVSVYLFDVESRIGVARPASAEVEAFVDPSDPVFPTDSEVSG